MKKNSREFSRNKNLAGLCYSPVQPSLPFQKPHSLLSLVLNTNVTIEGSRGVICKNIDKHEDKKNEMPPPRKENVEQKLLLLENIPKPWFFSAPS